jgi:hypothetical protein
MLYGSFANLGFVRDVVPADLLSKLKTEVASLDKTQNKYNRNLAGNIKQEFKLSTNHQELEQYVTSLCNSYTSAFDLKTTTRDLTSDNLVLDTYWVNIQEKNEFNPMHTHDGVYSFAIWIEVPYTINQELANPSCNNSNMPRAGMFSFIYTNVFGEVREAEFPVDTSYEGTIFLFPSCLPHTVYPFSTSDKQRISISGNLRRRHDRHN